MYKYFSYILSKWQYGFRKGFTIQHCLLVMTEKWRKCLDKEGIKGAILIDLSKDFDYNLRDLLIAKFASYARFKLAIRKSQFVDRLCLLPDYFKEFFVKFANQNFPSVKIFVFRETTKFLFTFKVRKFAYIYLV